MGPTILLDKCALQSLSPDELRYLEFYYTTVIPPVLIIEIIQDLCKYPDEQERSHGLVKLLSGKLPLVDSLMNIDHRTIIYGNLLGQRVPLDGRAVLPEGKEFKTADGKRAMFFDEPPQREWLRRWEKGEFSTLERTSARFMRDLTHNVDLDEFRKRIKDIYRPTKDIHSCEEIPRFVETILGSAGDELTNVKWLMKMMHFDQRSIELVERRWFSGGCLSFRDFAPYAFYCMRVMIAFRIALAGHLVGTRATNVVDLEYIYYLPFCNVFSSGDKFHMQFCKPFLRENQHFVSTDVLKGDLRRICEHWRNPDRTGHNLERYPPTIPDSTTYKIWHQHCRSVDELIESANKRKDEQKERRDEETMRANIDIMKKMGIIN